MTKLCHSLILTNLVFKNWGREGLQYIDVRKDEGVFKCVCGGRLLMWIGVKDEAPTD